MSTAVIDLNADVGERPDEAGTAEDVAIMAGVSSVSVACGFHAGDGETMRRACEAAVRLRKRIGAHVSFLDREGFGRRDVDVEPEVLSDQIGQQINALRATAVAAGGRVSYVKPHGALYNRAAVDPVSADAIAEAIESAIASLDQSLKLLAPPDSEMLRAAARRGIDGVAEGFADRAYRPDLTLAPRSADGSVLSTEVALAQARLIATEQRVITSDGASVSLAVRSLCLHSDTPGAAELAVKLRDGLIGAGVEIRPFA
jgi:UPF0271 protein